MGPYESAIVRIVGRAAGRPTAGVGVLVGSREVVTCAHVVNAALGRNHREQSQPATSDLVQLEFPMLPGPPVRTAAVAADAWRPPPQTGASGGDVAGLLLNEEAPAAAARAKFSRATEAPGTRLRVYGYPDMPPREAGAWVDVDFKGEVGGNLIQVESRQDQTIKAQPGYSGSPVWLDRDGVVVGLLHATAFADEPYRDAYLLPAQMVAEAWESQFDYLLVPQNPYRGLETFTVDDSALFFGRDTDIDALTARVTNQQLVMVVGPSGVGKSSLIQAGLIPRLKSEGRWSIAIVRPEKDPWHRLAAALLRAQRNTDPMVPAEQSRTDIELEIERLHREGLGPTGQYLRSIGRPLLLAVDQFEELLASSVTPDLELLELLLPPAGPPDDAIRLVHTVRADFLPLLLTVPGIGARLDQRVYFLSPLTGDQVRDAIERPAQARGVHFQDGLVDLIMREAAEGSLPLLEFTLTRMWQTQRRKTLDFTGYNNLGGLHGALDRFADEQVAKLADVTAAVIDRVLLRLVLTAPGDIELVTRQRVHQTGIPDTEWQALQQLAATRLVIVAIDPLGGSYAELAHEALITSWQRLYNLVQDNNDFLRWLAAIAGRAAEKDPLPEARIDDARRWLETRPEEIPESVKAFIKDSQTAAEGRLREISEARNRAEEARQQAEAAREAAEISARRAEALHLAANAELAFNRGSITIALALGVESFLTEPTLRGDLLLRRVLRMYARTRARLDHDDGVRAVAFAPDGSRVATGSMDGSARVFDAATSVELARLDHDDGVRAVAFSPDGTQVATGSIDGSRGCSTRPPAPSGPGWTTTTG